MGIITSPTPVVANMSGVTICLILLILAFAACAKDGNIHLLKDEVASAIKGCTSNHEISTLKRQRRFNNGQHNNNDNIFPRIDSNIDKEQNRYGHERRDPNDMQDQTTKYVLNVTVTPATVTDNNQSVLSNYSKENNIHNELKKHKRNTLFEDENDECLSQCVFANLEVVDLKGIPREAELWNKVQAAVSSQQSRTALRDQLRACFQELQSESEDNGCSYSNKLERCLMLHFSDRKLDSKKKNE